MDTGLEKADVAWKKKNEFNKCLDKFNKRVPIHNKRFHFSLERQSIPYEWDDEFNKRGSIHNKRFHFSLERQSIPWKNYGRDQLQNSVIAC
jgi:hypothetical protein